MREQHLLHISPAAVLYSQSPAISGVALPLLKAPDPHLIWPAVGRKLKLVDTDFPDCNCVSIPVKHARVLGWHIRHGHLQAMCLTRGHWLAWFINYMIIGS